VAGQLGARGIELPRPANALELVLAAVVEVQPRPRQQIGDCAGYKHFARMRFLRDARSNVDGNAAEVVAAPLALAGMKTGADLDAERARGGDDCLGAADGPDGAVEASDEAVAGGLDLAAAETFETRNLAQLSPIRVEAGLPSRLIRRMLCQSCDAENPEGKKFCIECGTALALSCASCGAALAGNEKFCGECGAPSSAQAAPGTTPPPAREPAHDEEDSLDRQDRGMRREPDRGAVARHGSRSGGVHRYGIEAAVHRGGCARVLRDAVGGRLRDVRRVQVDAPRGTSASFGVALGDELAAVMDGLEGDELNAMLGE